MTEHLPAILFLMLLFPAWYLVQRLCGDPNETDARPFACGACAPREECPYHVEGTSHEECRESCPESELDYPPP